MLTKLKMLYPALSDELLSLLLENATTFICDYCNLDNLDSSLNAVLFRIVQEDVTKLDSQGIASESAGGDSVSYASDYSPAIYRALNKHKRIRTVK